MKEVNELKDLYLAIGVGGVSFLALLGVLYFLLRTLLPIVNQIKQDGAITRTIIQNNTKALEEMSRSNQNVATALALLDKSMSNVHSDVKELLETTDEIDRRMLVIDEKLNHQIKEG